MLLWNSKINMATSYKNIQLSFEDIESNWNRFLNYIQQHVKCLSNSDADRKQILIENYESFAERFMLMPASTRVYYHNCFPGGYIDHVLRVTDYAVQFHQTWIANFGFEPTYDLDELIFAALNHDLGKYGSDKAPCYIPNTSSWHIDRGELYTINPINDFTTVSDRSLFTLQSWGVPVSINEMLGIKLHDGLYEEANKSYYINHSPQAKLRTNLPYVLHQADLTAARFEYTRWLKLNPYIDLSDQ